ncbi:hypothetical protein BOX37_28835 [Nocardia mangyaensis]|uniref:Uncharacterized protein n=2 Tax=Nocardia mangyaensis TaxID=2213200 RepID=A0A1J0VYY2_9NOCA|nr:hypothetical protein BOX37_28835 [Nocardia mangyaensis]
MVAKGENMTEQHEKNADPRARWRQLPPAPTELVEETAVDTSATDHGLPAIDLTQEFVRKYGL